MKIQGIDMIMKTGEDDCIICMKVGKGVYLPVKFDFGFQYKFICKSCIKRISKLNEKSR